MMERSTELYKIPFLIGVVGHRDLVAGEISGFVRPSRACCYA